MRPGIASVVLIAVASVLGAQSPLEPSPPTSPELRAHVEDGTVPVALESYRASVRIHGFLAETTVIMSFFNHDPRQLEGELVFPLPEGATVSGYGLDVNGVLVDAVVVEKDKARIVFEREAREQVDPGLVEWVGGNLFRTRVYPIPGESRRQIKLQYVSLLAIHDGRATYRLPLSGLPVLERLQADIAVHGSASTPVTESHPFSELVMAGNDGRYTAGGSLTRARPAADLEVSIALPASPTVVVDETTDGEYAFAIAETSGDDLATRRRRAVPRRVAVLWDGSFSRHEADHSAATRFLEVLLERWRPHEVSLTVFRDVTETSRVFRVRDGRSQELLDAVAGVEYDGATRWSSLDLPSELDADAVVLVTDGRPTLGASRLPRFDVPVFAVAASSAANHQLLRHMAEASGGLYTNLAQGSPERLVDDLDRIQPALLSVEVVEGSISEVSAPVGRPIQGPTVISGLLHGARGRLRLEFGHPGRVVRVVHVTIDGDHGPGLVERFRAQQRLADLAVLPGQNRAEMLALGRRYSLVTPETSLMVLENLDQYLEYRIEPPASLPDLLEQYRQMVHELDEDVREIQSDHLARLKADWAAYLDPPPPDPPTPAPERHTPRPRQPQPPPTPTPAPEVATTDGPSGAPRPHTVHGVVQNGDLGPLPGVTITLTSAALRGPLTMTSGRRGEYRSDVLVPGEYTVEFTLLGFTTQRQDVHLRPGNDLSLDMTMDLESFAEEIQVTAEVGRSYGAMTAHPYEVDGINTADLAAAGSSAIAVRPWNPETPYLEALGRSPEGELYGAYLEQRRVFGSSPSFFVDCARFFLEHGQRQTGLRILSALLDLELEEPRLMRVSAMLYLEHGDVDAAIEILERLTQLRPELPQSFRDLALALAARARGHEETSPALARADLDRAIELLHQVVFEPWGPVPDRLQQAFTDDARFEEISRIALVELHWVMRRYQALFGTRGDWVFALDQGFEGAIESDLRIVLTWDDDFADLDLWVTEPSGEQVSYQNPLSATGGLLSHDCTEGLGPESYTSRKALPGIYRITTDYYADLGPQLLGPVTVQASIFTNFGRDNEVMKIRTVRLEDVEDEFEIATVSIGR